MKYRITEFLSWIAVLITLAVFGVIYIIFLPFLILVSILTPNKGIYRSDYYYHHRL